MHSVKLIFGDGYANGDIEVSPENMLIFLSKPFVKWLNADEWKGINMVGWDIDKFSKRVYEETSHMDDEDYQFKPYYTKWIGFRVDMEQLDAECEFVFTTQTINGQIRPDYEMISGSIVEKLQTIRRISNEIIQDTKLKNE